MEYEEENNEAENAFERVIETIYDKKYGIMGTLAFHMIFAIALLFSNIQTVNKEIRHEIVMDFDQNIDKKIEKLKKEIKQKKVERTNKNEETVNKLLKSIAVNENIKSKAKSSNANDVDKLIKDIQKELDAKGSHSKQKHSEAYKKDSIKYHKDEAARKLDSIQTVYYSGPSSVSYNLKGRYKEYLPIPVFKCEDSGLVKVEIIVNSNGRVRSARILENGSKTEDQCLWDTALDAAKRSRFSTSSTSTQTGTITYNFIKQ